MNDARTAPLVGIAGCVAVILALAYPYVAVDGSVGTYYGSGVVNPLVAGLLAIVSIIVLAAGRENRTEPDFAAGVALIFGVFVTLLLVFWALTVRVDVVEITPLHRWGAAAVSLVIPVASAWYARALGLL
jgi:hypothetical protein